MTNVIKKAFDHVKSKHPEVTHVVYTAQGLWAYMDDSCNMPKFENGVNIKLLEDASDASDWPSVHYFGEDETTK